QIYFNLKSILSPKGLFIPPSPQTLLARKIFLTTDLKTLIDKDYNYSLNRWLSLHKRAMQQ
ncbi:MAG: hypothetical protein ABIN67_02375, partial [Ferruginibacter sp.]